MQARNAQLKTEVRTNNTSHLEMRKEQLA